MQPIKGDVRGPTNLEVDFETIFKDSCELTPIIAEAESIIKWDPVGRSDVRESGCCKSSLNESSCPLCLS